MLYLITILKKQIRFLIYKWEYPEQSLSYIQIYLLEVWILIVILEKSADKTASHISYTQEYTANTKYCSYRNITHVSFWDRLSSSYIEMNAQVGFTYQHLGTHCSHSEKLLHYGWNQRVVKFWKKKILADLLTVWVSPLSLPVHVCFNLKK